jgi:hypothetical protein
MGPLRKFMVLSCAGLTLALWAWAWQRPDVHTSGEMWPLQWWGGVALVASVMTTQPQGRRLHFSAALVLLLSAWLLPAWHVVMPYEGWLAAGMPDKPHLAELPQLIGQQVWHLAQLEWVRGLSRQAGAWLVIGVHAQHPVIPAWSRYTAKAGIALWLLTVLAFAGTWLSGAVADAPLWFWGLLVVGLPFQLKSGHVWLVVGLWLLSAAALLAKTLSLIVAPMALRDTLLALACAATLLCWLAWYARMEAATRFDAVLSAVREIMPKPPEASAAQPTGHVSMTADVDDAHDNNRLGVPAAPFDLTRHLDSPQAQEGADKYTRE